MAEDIRYIGKYSNVLTLKEKEDFLNLFNKVFNLNYNLDWFNWKYMDNVYGASYMVFAYDKEKLVGIRSFWRNDIGKTISYQPCDTAVSKEYRGRGIFSQMTRLALEEVGGNFIYNFPNENSLPGNLKLGWEIDKYAYLALVGKKSSLKSKTQYIEDDYLVWKFAKSPLRRYYYYEHQRETYLLYKRKKNLYYVLGRINNLSKKHFEKAYFPILFNYTNKETLMYKIFKNRATIISLNKTREDINIPIFKADYF